MNFNHQKFGEKRVIFLNSFPKNELPTLREDDILSVKDQKEAEGPELDTKTLVKDLNGEIYKRYLQLAFLPQELRVQMKREIVRFIKNSPSRFDKDEHRGLSEKEFFTFSQSMKKRVKGVLDAYAPSAEVLKKKKEAEKSQKEVLKAAKEFKAVNLDEIKSDPGDISDLNTLSDRYVDFDTWNQSTQQESQTAIASIQTFRGKYGEFMAARQGLKSYTKFADYFGISDEGTYEEIKSLKKASMEAAEANIERVKKAQEKLETYGETLGKVSNKLKSEKIKERDAHLKRIEDNESLSEDEKVSRKKQFEQLNGQSDVLKRQKEALETYKETVLETKKDKIDDRIELAETRSDQLASYDEIMSDGLRKIDVLLKNPELSDVEKELLTQTRDQISEKQASIYLGQIGAETVINESEAEWNKLDESEQAIAQKYYSLDGQLELIDQDMSHIESHLGVLSRGILQFTDSKEVINTHYKKVFDVYDGVDEAVDNAVLSHNIATTKVISTLKAQTKGIDRLSIEEPSGLGGLYEATAGAAFGTLGGGLMASGEWMINNATELDRELRLAKEDGMGPAEYWIKKVGLETASFAIGTAGGLAEMGGGLAMMAADPAEAAAGMGNLIGRSSETGDWSTDTLKDAWTNMGRGMVSWEDFEAGRIGVGLGKIFPNVVLSLTGAGVAAQSTRAGLAAMKVAKAAGKTAGKSIKAGIKVGSKVAWKESLNVVKSPAVFAKKAWSKTSEIVKNPLTFGKDVVDLAINSKNNLAARNKLTQKLFGKEAVERGLSQKETELMKRIERNAQKIKEYAEVKSKIKGEHPQLSNAEIDFRLSQERPVLFAENIAAEVQIKKLIKKRNKDDEFFEVDDEIDYNAGTEELGTAQMQEILDNGITSNIPLKAVDRLSGEINIIKSSKQPLTKEVLEEILRSDRHTDELRKALLDNPNISIDPKIGTRNDLFSQIEAAEILGNDIRLLQMEFDKVGGMIPEASKLVTQAIEGTFAGQGNQLTSVFERLKKESPQTFELVRNTDSKILVESGCLEEILRGFKIESNGSQGVVGIYVGNNNLGKGAFGSVDEVLFHRPGDKKLTRGAYKKAHGEAQKEIFNIERADAKKIMDEWEDHPNIIKPLDIGEDYIIYETGSNANSLDKAVKTLPAEGMFKALQEATEGVEHIWSTGHFHGDIKPANIISYMDKGERVTKIIDLSPSELEKMQAKAYTPLYSFTEEQIQEAAKALMKREGMKPIDAASWISRAQDSKALGISFSGASSHYLDLSGSASKKLSAKQGDLIMRTQQMVVDANDILKAGDPKFTVELKKLMSDLEIELRRSKSNPNEPSILKDSEDITPSKSSEKAAEMATAEL